MARNISDIFNLMDFIIRKERGAFITIPEAMSALDAGQMICFNDWFKLYGINQELHDALRPFRVYYQFTSDAVGMVTFPSGYLHQLADTFTVSGSTVNKVSFLNEDEFVDALNSQLRPVSLSKPIARDTATGFSLFPQSVQTGFFTYLKRPATPVYGYTEVGRVITYNSATSTQLEWSDAYIDSVIAKALQYLGVNLDDKGVQEFSQILNAETK